MNPEITQLIERYLLNELSAAERQSFELQLAENDQLLQELILHRQLHEAAKRATQRDLVQQTAKRYHFRKNVVTSSIVVLVVATVAAITVWATNRNNNQHTESAQQELVAELEADKHTPLEHIVAEYFHLNEQDTVVLSKTGVLLSIPDGAFLLNGKPYSGPKMIQWQEAINAADIIKAGLSTFAGEHLLETQGMFALQAFAPDGTKLNVNPEVGVYVQVPVDELKEGMMLFEGKKMNNGIVDWQNPQPMTKLPQLADMNDLDFYPQGYEAKLDGLKWKTGKKERDSLYLSFEDEPEPVAISDSIISESGRAFIIVEPFVTSPQANISKTLIWDSALYLVSSATSVELPEDMAKWNFTIEQNGSEATIVARVTIKSSWHINSVFRGNGAFGFPTQFILNDSKNYSEIGLVEEPAPIMIYDEIADENLCIHRGTVVFKQKIRVQNEKDFVLYGQYSFQPCDSTHCLAPFQGNFAVNVKGSDQKEHIPPSSVIAFWQPKFNNTILATRDFEKRMKAIHATCDKDVLEAYTDNLNKPLYEIDEKIAKMGYPEFSEFAAERVGGVELDNPHMNNLRQFYAGAISTLQKELKKDRNFVRKQEMAWDNSLRRLRTEEFSRTARRRSLNNTEEARFNYGGMLRQLSNRPVIGFTIRRVAQVYNCDRYVSSGTLLNAMTSTQRDTATVEIRTPVFTPLKAPEYESFSVSVKNNTDYGKTMVYLFPKQVKSFQRLEGSGGKFDGRLNKDMQYDMLIVGIAENGFYLYEETGISGGQKTISHLEPVSELEFNRRVEAMNANRLDKPMAVFDELEWLVKEQQNYRVQRLRMEREAFRNIIRPIVFPCLKDIVRDEIEPENPEVYI
ncbi:MAG: hypothetical protein V4604_04395 [Bacteroidota bacterium]